MKIWVDDLRPAPEGWIWYKTTNEALRNMRITLEAYKRLSSFIEDGDYWGEEELEQSLSALNANTIEIVSLDHDAGPDEFGGDFINILSELERLEHIGKIEVNFPIRLHSANPVGVQNMRAIIQKNGWKEVFDI